jgi:hypothetical protein
MKKIIATLAAAVAGVLLFAAPAQADVGGPPSLCASKVWTTQTGAITYRHQVTICQTQTGYSRCDTVWRITPNGKVRLIRDTCAAS